MFKKCMALIMSLALVCSLCACGGIGGSKTSYLTLASELQALEGQEVKGSMEMDISGLVDSLDSNDMAVKLDMSKITLSYEGEMNKVDGELDAELKLGDLDPIKINYVSKEGKVYLHKDLINSVMDLIVDLVKKSGENDEMTNEMMKSIKEGIEEIIKEDYILIDVEELVESTGVSVDIDAEELTKVDLTETYEKLNAFLSLCDSSMLSKTKDGYTIEFSSEILEKDIDKITNTMVKKPEKFLQALVDLADAMESDMKKIGMEDMVEGLDEMAEVFREPLEDKEKMKNFKKSLKDKDELEEFKEIFDSLKDLGVEVKASIKKSGKSFVTRTELSIDTDTVKGLKIKMEQTNTPKDVSISEPKSATSIEDILEGAGLMGGLSIGNSGLTGSVTPKPNMPSIPTIPSVDLEDDEEEDRDINRNSDRDEDEEEDIKPSKKPTSNFSKNGEIFDIIGKFNSMNDCSKLHNEILDVLGGSWEETYNKKESDYIAVKSEQEYTEDFYAESDLMLMDDAAFYGYSIRLYGEDNLKDREKMVDYFYTTLETLMGDTAEDSMDEIEELVDAIVSGKSKDKSFRIDITDDIECSFGGYSSGSDDWKSYSLSVSIDWYSL